MGVRNGPAPGVVLMDAGYGHDGSLRKCLTELELTYSAGIRGTTLVVATAPKAGTASGTVNASELGKTLPKRGWRKITWRDGTNTPLSSRLQRVRVRATGDGTTAADPEEWLLIEWLQGEKEPTKFWLSTLAEAVTIERMIDLTMMRWRIERDYHELQQEVGLGHVEGCGWRGFHHHATMCIAAYGFLVSERGAFPPRRPRSGNILQEFAFPQGYRPRGSPAAA
jgi:SRSO17 transposase